MASHAEEPHDSTTLGVPFTKSLSRYRDIALYHYEPDTSVLIHLSRDFRGEAKNLRITFTQLRKLLDSKTKIHSLICRARKFQDTYLRHQVDDHLRITLNSNLGGITLRKQCSFIFLKYPEWYNFINAREEIYHNIAALKVDGSKHGRQETPTASTAQLLHKATAIIQPLR